MVIKKTQIQIEFCFHDSFIVLIHLSPNVVSMFIYFASVCANKFPRIYSSIPYYTLCVTRELYRQLNILFFTR